MDADILADDVRGLTGSLNGFCQRYNRQAENGQRHHHLQQAKAPRALWGMIKVEPHELTD
jgi:hypothetical protein